VLFGELLAFSSNRVKLLNLRLSLGKSLLQTLCGDFHRVDRSLVLKVLLDSFTVFSVKLLNFVLELLRVLDVSLDLFGDLHPRAGVVSESVDVEDLVDAHHRAILGSTVFLDCLDEALKLIII